MKVKHAPEQSMGQRNNRKNKTILKYIKMEIQHRQTYGKLHKSNKRKVVKSIHIGNDEAKLSVYRRHNLTHRKACKLLQIV